MKVYTIVSVLAFAFLPEDTGSGVPVFALIAFLAFSLDVGDADLRFTRWRSCFSPLPFLRFGAFSRSAPSIQVV